ncbi:MAG: cytochrome c peroxidase, partial [Planctomycetaceae bacterium]
MQRTHNIIDGGEPNCVDLPGTCPTAERVLMPVGDSHSQRLILWLSRRAMAVCLLGGGLLAVIWTGTRVNGEPPTKGASIEVDPHGESDATAESLAARSRPSGVIWDESTGLIRVACEGTGELVSIDPKTYEVVAEQVIGQRIVDLCVVPGTTNQFFALDAGGGRLLLLESTGPQVQAKGSIKVPEDSLRIHVSPDASQVFVSSRWTHTLTIVSIEPQTDESREVEPLRLVASRRMPFAPREMLWLPNAERLLVADAFRCRVAIVEPEKWSVTSIREWPGNNIRGLVTSADESEIHVVQQHLNKRALADFDDVTWGILLFNGVRVFGAGQFLDPEADLVEGAWIVSLGNAENHAGDPGPVRVTPDGRLAMLYQGAREVAFGSDRYHLNEVEVGERPVALAWSPSRETLYVANQLSDSISVVDAVNKVLLRTISIGTDRPLTAAERGEQLFFSAKISLDSWMSCSTCHAEGHTVDEIVDTLGDNDYGAPKRIPSLLGVHQTPPWAWTGASNSLAEQVEKSIRTTMHGPPVTADQVSDIVAYLETLTPPPAIRQPDEPAVVRGGKQFATLGCAKCHTPPAYTSDGVYDVGLVDEAGRTEFNPPSLLGVGHRSRFLHDGRASTLRDLFHVHQHQLKEPLADAAVDDLIAFLESLSTISQGVAVTGRKAETVTSPDSVSQ